MKKLSIVTFYEPPPTKHYLLLYECEPVYPKQHTNIFYPTSRVNSAGLTYLSLAVASRDNAI